VHSSNIRYIPRLDHLRGIAALIVFIYHLYHHFFHHWKPNPDAWFLGLMVEGHTGVGLFFVLSGFILMLIRMNTNRIDYRDFMRNRFLRIFPLFLVVFFVAISIGRDQFRPADLFYLLFSNLGQAPTSNSFITGAAWTISVEFTFYAAFPFIAYAALNKGISYLPRLILILLLFKCGAWFISEHPKHMYYSTLLGRMDQFLIGMLAAMLYLKLRQAHRLSHWIWLPLALLCLCAALPLVGRGADGPVFQLPVVTSAGPLLGDLAHPGSPALGGGYSDLPVLIHPGPEPAEPVAGADGAGQLLLVSAARAGALDLEPSGGAVAIDRHFCSRSVYQPAAGGYTESGPCQAVVPHAGRTLPGAETALRPIAGPESILYGEGHPRSDRSWTWHI